MGRLPGLLAASLSLSACIIEGDGTLTCTFIGCSGIGASITLVDDVGNTVGARGEYRYTPAGFTPYEPLPFDCTLTTPEPGSQPTRCNAGTIALPDADPSLVLELRYELEPGTHSEWERVQLRYTSHTDADLGGPGCDCTWYEVTPRSTLVPVAARRPLP